jgi:uncharacterized membrane protein (DUF2068 family)
VDWSTLACGRFGHTTYAPDEPDVRAQLEGQVPGGAAWQCLRCGAFVPGQADASGPAADAPAVLRGAQVRSRLILKLFAVERLLRVLVFAAASYLLWRFRSAQSSIERTFDRELPVLRDLFRQLGYNIDHSRLVGLFEHALTLSSHSITLLALGAAGYAAIEVVEAVGLWLGKRWGEYFAAVATSIGLPLEVYDLSHKVTATALVLLAVNIALVAYLLITKRLFGIRGGKRAYDARLREESVMDAAIAAARRQQAEEHQQAEASRPTAARPDTQASPHTEASRQTEASQQPGARPQDQDGQERPGGERPAGQQAARG